jgi:hypothetical protein
MLSVTDVITKGLLGASNWFEIQAQCAAPGSAPRAAPASFAAAGAAPVLDEPKVKIFSFVTGVASLAGDAGQRRDRRLVRQPQQRGHRRLRPGRRGR